MNSDWNHPVIGICILVFFVSMLLLALCVSLFDVTSWFFLSLLPSLALATLGGLIAALWLRLRRLETQVRFLQEQLYKLEKDCISISKI